MTDRRERDTGRTNQCGTRYQRAGDVGQGAGFCVGCGGTPGGSADWAAAAGAAATVVLAPGAAATVIGLLLAGGCALAVAGFLWCGVFFFGGATLSSFAVTVGGSMVVTSLEYQFSLPVVTFTGMEVCW